MQASTGSVNYLVDPKFREQFEIAHASPRYAAVLAAAPADFVGTEERIVPLVELLCAEMSAAFRAAGATLPPWRQAGAMLSKWRPRRSEDAGAKPPPAAAARRRRAQPRGQLVGQPAGGLPMAAPLAGPPLARGPPALRRYSMGGPAGARLARRVAGAEPCARGGRAFVIAAGRRAGGCAQAVPEGRRRGAAGPCRRLPARRHHRARGLARRACTPA